jgi:hypothetical protein
VAEEPVAKAVFRTSFASVRMSQFGQKQLVKKFTLPRVSYSAPSFAPSSRDMGFINYQQSCA